MRFFHVLCAGSILLILQPRAAAQFQALTTTDDGSTVYFATSLRQKGTGQPFHGKIFRYDAAAGAVLHASVDREPPAGGYTNYFDLSAPDVSGDGRVVAFTMRRDCFGFAACVAQELTRSRIRSAAGPEVELTGWTRLSQNGLWAVHADGISGPADFRPAVYSLAAERDNPAPASLRRGAFAGQGRVISNSGEFVYVNDSGLVMVDAALEARTLLPRTPRDEQLLSSVLDAEGRVVVFVSRWPSPFHQFTRLRVFTRSDGTVRTLIEGYGDYYQPVLSNDGTRVLFLSTACDDGSIGPSQVFVAGIDGSGARQLTNLDAGVHTATLSGDGRAAWAVTGEGSLVRIDVGSGAVSEAIGPTPTVRGSVRLARGSLQFLDGTGLVGFHGSLNGIALPVLLPGNTSAGVQIPWELPPGTYQLTFQTDANSEWDPSPVTLSIAETAPAAILAGPYPPITAFSYPFVMAAAAHGDWSGLVTESNPARRGEIVHLYATGLGPVQAPVRTGEPSPAEPLPRLIQRLACSYYNTESTLALLPEPLYAGLAPGLIGVYQISLRIPADLDTSRSPLPGILHLECELQSGGSFQGLVPLSRK